MRVRLLGGLEVAGLRPTEIGSRKARTLLSVLALGRGAPVAAERVVAALWGDRPPARPGDQVGVLVSRLRRVLGADRVVRAGAGWALRLDWLDLDELELRVEEAAARLAAGAPGAAREAARAALALVRGELLADEADAPWADAERAAVGRLVARAGVLAAEAALAAGDPYLAANAAEAALDREPYDEVALRVLMRAHVAAGRPAAALAVYARARARLADELGADPAAATEALHAAMLRGAAAEPVPDAPPPAPLVGRSAELAALDARLDGVRAGATAFVVVEGEPGIGKTALVTRWAAAADAVALLGRCDELGRAPALQPVLDALDGHLRRRGPDGAAALFGADAAVIAPLLGGPELPPVAGPTAPPGDPAAGRALLFAALLRTLSAAAGDAAFALVVDDLHHADASTHEFLRFAVRRGRRLIVVATRRPGGPPIPEADTLTLAPLGVEAVAELVGGERAPALLARSGGNPLFLVALAGTDPDAVPDALPVTIRDAVGARADDLGAAAGTLRAAAVLGREIDVDLLAAVLGAGVRELLGHLEDGVRARLLDDHDGALVFAHELVREALAETVTPARRVFAHREAARVLSRRPESDPGAVARHARLGGDAALAASALVTAAARAVARHDLAGADAHLDEATALADGAAVRVARARLELVRNDLAAAAGHAERALALGAGAEGLELAGWVAYYRRDYRAAERYAQAGREQAADAELRASCGILLGRVHHSRGVLGTADALLAEAAEAGPPTVRGTARAWLAGVRCHQGRPADALELVERALLDPGLRHPFVAGHALFARAYALGQRGEPVAGMQAVDRLEGLIAEQPEPFERFVGAAANLRAWLLRGVGRESEARDRNAAAVALTGTGLAEARAAGLLDLADGHLRAGDLPGAAAALAQAEPMLAGEGTMFWHQRHRQGLLRARLALADGRGAEAHEAAAAVAADAAARGAERYRVLAALVAARAAASRGERVDRDAVDGLLTRLDAVAGLEAWWVTAETAAAFAEDRWWRAAERRAARLVSAAARDADALRRAVDDRLTALGRS